MPALRFKDKNGQAFEAQDELTIQDLFDKVKTTNKDGANKNVITNSAEHGLIPQREFFDKDIAVEGNTSKYTIIKDGDFVYNPRKSSTAPYGPFNCYTREEPGIVSPLYSCLTPKNKAYTPYLLYYFASPAWYSYIYHNGNQGGARHDRVGMTDDLLQGIPVLLPCQEEQDKITAFLSLYDKRIAAQASKVEALEARRKGLLQQIFSQEIRFKADDGSEFPDWKDTRLGDIFYRVNERNDGTFDKTKWISVAKMYYQDPEKVTSNNIYTRTYVMRFGDIAFEGHPNSEFLYGRFVVNDIGDGVISELFPIYRHKEKEYVNNYWKYAIQIENIMAPIYQKAILISGNSSNKLNEDDFLRQSIPVPCIAEQHKIASMFILVDKQIQLEKDKLEAIKQVKKGLLQQIFV